VRLVSEGLMVQTGNVTTTLGGSPLTFTKAETFVDFPGFVVGLFHATGAPGTARPTLELMGAQGSLLEGEVFNQVVAREGIAAVTALTRARREGQTVEQVDAANVDSVLATVDLGQDVEAQVRQSVSQGRVAWIPQAPITVNQWQGVGFVLSDPTTGAGGYLLTGGFAGGADTGTLDEAFQDVLGDETWLSDGAFGELFGRLREVLGGGPGDDADPETNYGDPINLATGNLWMTENDLFVIARGLPIDWSRTYNSRSTVNGPLGFGWTFSLGESLQTEADGSVLYREADGSEHRFEVQADGSFSPPAGKHQALSSNAGGFTVRDKDGTLHRFDLAGRLISLADRNQNQLRLTYGANGLPSTVIDAAGRTALTVTTDGSKIRSLEDLAGRRVEYTYEGDDLAAVQDASGETWTFQYDGDHNLVSRGNPLGETETYIYDTLDRCIAHTDPIRATETFHYAQRGKSAVVTDRRGYSSYLEFDETGRTVLQVDPLGNPTRSTWDTDNNRLTTVDPRGGVTTRTYDERGNLLTQTDPLGNTTTATYEPGFSHRLTVADALGHTLENKFDESGNLIETSRVVDGERLTQSFGYDENGQVMEIRDFAGSLARLEWNPNQGTLESLTDALNQSVLFEYDALGRISLIIDPLDNAMQFTWDARSRLSTFVDPYGNQQSFEYGAAGRRTASTTPQGRSITEYDAAGRAIREADVQGNAFVRGYDAAGNLITEVDPMGNRWSMTYDALGRLTSRIDPLGQIWTLGYCAEILAGTGFATCGAGGCRIGAGAEGSFCRLVDPLGNVIEQEHDALGRVTGTTDPLGNTTRAIYDAMGRRSAVVDALGNSTTFEYDALGRLVTVVEADGSRAAYEYDPNGNLIKAIDGEGHESTWAYDVLNRRISETDPLGNITEFEYDALSNLINKRTATGDPITYTYDFKRLLSIQVPGKAPERLIYNQIGQRVGMESDDVSLGLVYDSLDRLIQTTDHKVGETVTYRHDALGRDRERDDSRGTVRFFHDGLGRVFEQQDSRHGTFRFRYDELGRREAIEYPNGLVSRYAYDAASRLESVIVFDRTGGVVDGYRYAHDGKGRRTSMTSLRDNVVHQYDYDARGNLVHWQRSNGDFEVYTYDRVGNRLTKETPDLSTSYAYDAASQLLSTVTQFVTGSQIRTEYLWNADGTLAEKSAATGLTNYQWDARGRLLQVAGGSTMVSYGYDPLGIRVSEADASGVHRFLHSKGEIIGVYEGDTEVTSYSHGPGVDEVLAQRSDEIVSYLHHDGLGSVTALSNVQGELAGTVRYGAFGEAEASGGVTSRFGFTGREVDTTNLMYYRSRYLDPTIGRFLSRDVEPLRAHRPATLQRYSYVENDPINNVDPTGRITISWAVKIMGSFLLGAVAGIGLGKLLKVTGPQRGRDHLLGNFALGVFITILSLLILIAPVAYFSTAFLQAVFAAVSFLASGGAILACNFPGILHEIMIYSGDWPLDLMENFIGCSLGYLVGLTVVIASPSPVIAFVLGMAVGYALVIQDLL
jgi:RHS repeat-associated protein